MDINGIIILLIIIFLLAVFIAFLSTPFSIKFARKVKIIDIPKDERRMHNKPIPRGGGIAIFISASLLLIGTIWFFGKNLIDIVPLENKSEIYGALSTKIPALLIGGTVIFVLGIIDDKFNLPPIVKLLGQTAAALIVFYLGIRIDAVYLFFGKFGEFSVFTSLLTTVLYIILVTNIINLIDGLDGLAAGVSLIASCFISYTAYIHGHYIVTLLFIILAGACLGFLPFNFFPAKTFMGDMGSQYIGFYIACSSIIGPAKEATILTTIVPVFILGVPIIDTFLAFLRRIITKKSFMEADKKHIHHRIFQNKLGHVRSVLLIYCVSGVMGLSAISFSRGEYLEFLGGFIIAIIIVIVLIANKNSNK